jgi:hypothetical protein
MIASPTTLSYAETLRTIGQSLELLRIESFELRKKGEEYIVGTEHNKPGRETASATTFLTSFAEMVWGSPDADKPTLLSGQLREPLRYTPFDIYWLNSQGHARRGKETIMPDAHKLSQSLRVVGDYLDRKKARACAVSWSTQSVTVNCESTDRNQIQENFAVENLYDLSLSMHQRRSTRRPKS